ncbi:MAG: hypothetical protein WCY88_17875 [Spongiibacteraceae bacterium]
MGEHKKAVTPAKCVTVIIFALFAICALLAFGYYAFDVSISLISKKEIIEFNKGAMYMLGVGLGAGLLVIFMIHELIGKEISNAYNKKATKCALISIGLIFIFPQLADYIVSSKFRSMDYVFCEEKSYRWLHAQNKVYGANVDACSGIKANEITKSSSGR